MNTAANGLPSYYKFPDEPTGLAQDPIYGDIIPYHRLAEDEVVLLFKSHTPGIASQLLRLSQTAFMESFEIIS